MASLTSYFSLKSLIPGGGEGHEHNTLTMSDDQILEQIISTHVHSDTKFDVGPLSSLVDNTLTRCTHIVAIRVRLKQGTFPLSKKPQLPRISSSSLVMALPTANSYLLLLFSFISLLFFILHAKIDIDPSDLTKNLAPTKSQVTSAPAPKYRKHLSNSLSFQDVLAQAPTTQHHEHKSGKRKLVEGILGGLIAGFAGGICGFIFCWMIKLAAPMIKGEGKSSVLAIYSRLIKKAKDLDFLKKEDGVNSLEMIGRGECGEVYKAELPGSNKIIAIKKVVQPSNDVAELSEGCQMLVLINMH